MKKIYFFNYLFFILVTAVNAQTAFTPGNLVVYKVGDGTDVLSSAPFPVSLDEFTTGGTFVRSHPMPVAVSGSNKRLVGSGTATSEGQLTLSANKQYLVVSGYDTFPAPAQLGIASSLATSVNRVVGLVDVNGTIDATTALTDAYSANNFRGATSTDGVNIWLAGTGTPTTSAGVRFTTKGSTTSTQISTTATNIEAVNIFNGQLYSTSAKGSFDGLCADGTGTPTTIGQTITLLSGFPSSSGPGPAAFSISPSGDTAYVADSRATTSGGGIQKWVFSDTKWNLVYTLTSGLDAGLYDLVADWSSAEPIIYATTGDASPNKIVSVTDAGASSAFTVLATASANYVYKGIAFAPVPTSVTPVTLINFGGTLVSSSVYLQWATAQEINTQQFEIEKSTDGINFTAIGEVAANGTSTITHNYQYTDKNPAEGNNYYRLKTIDIDGAFSYSKVVVINYLNGEFSIYPNPASQQITVSHPAGSNGLIVISDLQGRKIKSINSSAGSTSDNISLERLSNGQYIVRYSDNAYSNVHSVIKQ